MSIAEALRAAVAATNDLDRQMARRIGEHIDTQAQGLQELLNLTEAKALAPASFRSLPPATADELGSLKVPELKAIATRMQLPGRSKAKRKSDLIAFLMQHRAPLAPSYEQLLAFWVQHR